MLVIRKEQIDAMLKGNEDDFLATLVRRVVGDQPELGSKYDQEQLRAMAGVALQRAETYGITYAMDQIEFVALMFQRGPRFDAEPEIRSILEEAAVPAAQKLQRLDSPMVPETVWEKIAAERDDTKWFGS